MSKIFWDSMIFIYWMEGHVIYAPKVQKILQAMQSRGDILYTTHLAAGEVLVGPQKKKATDALARIEKFFRSDAVRLLAFDFAAALEYSKVRAQMNIAPADAIHLACAATEGMDLFITNDKNLKGKSIPGIQFIVGLDTNLF